MRARSMRFENSAVGFVLAPVDLRAEVRDAGGLTGREDVEGNHVVEPVVAGAVEVLSRDRDGVLVRGEPAVEGEIDFKFFARFEFAEIDALDFGVRSVNVHSDAITDQYADHGLRAGLIEDRAHADGDPLAARNGGAGAAVVIEEHDVEDFAGAVAVAI